MTKNTKKVRLSKEIVPTEYDIKLHPDLENFTFVGEEEVKIEIKKETKIITLHSKEIQIDTASINSIFATISYNEESETATFTFKNKIKIGKYKLKINFKGILNDKMRGFYRSSYIYEGKMHNMATTQFEATDARRAFPCFDEPAHKAVFHVSLVVPKGKTAISNTVPVSNTKHESGFEVIKFAPSPKMSTYLLAFIVGDFEYIEQKSKRGVIVRVYTTPGKIHQAKFSLDVTVKVLDFYEEYFDIPYPLNTLDMIAIPDFQSLAMENWGAITFREVGLLVDEKNTSVSSKELIVEVIAHELAHQWFGNLVTMEWWTHLWLNEGFASYVPYLVIEKLFPEWNIWERFNSQRLGSALKLDALANTHPIETEVHHPNEIGEIFDEVSYSKGASVIRMLADYLGEKDFRDGLRYYLKKHSYKNTKTIHLWQAFEKISKKPVEKIMQNWTQKSGYPVIKASLGTSNANLILKQERFFSNSTSKSKSKDTTTWQVPISFNLESKLPEKILLSNKNILLGGLTAKWVKLNSNESGFFRTAYSRELLDGLHEPVLNKILNPIDRLGIVRDLFALSEAGIIPTTDALEFLSSYKNEDNYPVWVEIAGGLAKLKQLLAKTKKKEAFDIFCLALFSPLAHSLGWEKKKNEKHTDALLRSLSISFAGRSGDKKIIIDSKKKFTHMRKGSHIDADLRNTIYGIVASNGTKKEYDIFIKLYKNEVLHEEKNRIGHALTDFRDVKLLEKTCEFATNKHVRIQDTVSILSGIAINPIGRDVWMQFIIKNWKELLNKYGENAYTLSALV
ncbi:MAG: M1 family metallopeptidase, partial [bacterium]|nr:M1 family metallopeptidase [bacterium]